MNNDEVEKSESGLDKSITNLKSTVESLVTSLSIDDIAKYAGKIPQIKTMLEFRVIRDDFLTSVEKSTTFEAPRSRLSKKMSDCLAYKDIGVLTPQSIEQFFMKELDRAKKLRERAKRKCAECGLFQSSEGNLIEYMESLTTHVYKCEEAILRLHSGPSLTYTEEDLFLIIRSFFLKHIRTDPVKIYLNDLRCFPLTNRRSIISSCLQRAEQDLISGGPANPPNVPIFISSIKDLDSELIRLAKFFHINQDLITNDGQVFVYNCESFFPKFIAKLEAQPSKVIEANPKKPQTHNSLSSLIDESTLSDVEIVENISHIFDLITKAKQSDALNQIKEEVSHYNSMVGTMAIGDVGGGMLKRKKLLPSDKLFCWYKLRLARCKYLWAAITSRINYFEAIRHNLTESNLTWKTSETVPQLIDVIQNGQPILMSSTSGILASILKQLKEVASYFIKKSEKELIDIHSVVEQILEAEFQFYEAKRSLIQSLYEIFYHNGSSSTIIESFIDQRPKLRIHQFSYFDLPYRLSTDIVTEKANILRSLINLQIIHERQLAFHLPASIPIFERPSIIPCHETKLFSDSVPLSPIECFHSLGSIVKFFDISSIVATELSQSIDLKYLKFGDYMEISVLKLFSSRISKLSLSGCLPFTYISYPFVCEIPSSTYSLLSSHFFTNFSTIETIIGEVPEGRKLRASLSAFRLLKIGFSLISSLIDSDRLQSAYTEQSPNDPHIFLSSLKSKTEPADPKTLDFAISEYERFDFNFESIEEIRQLLSTGSFDRLCRVLQFQRFHCTEIECAILYNSLFNDCDFLVSHFGFSEQSDLFLTQGDVLSADSIVRSFLSTTLLFDSSYILPLHKAASEKRELFSASIKDAKTAARLSMSSETSEDNYIQNMAEQFNAFSLRYSLANICREERQLLQMNSYTDAFILPPSNTKLINEIGNIQSFFVVPMWVEIIMTMRNAPIQRANSVLEAAEGYEHSLMRILKIVRFECSVSQKSNEALSAMDSAEFKMEVGDMQKLLSQLVRLPNGTDVDVAAKFIEKKLEFYERRLEASALLTTEKFKDANPIVEIYEDIRKNDFTFLDSFLGGIDEELRGELSKSSKLTDSKVEAFLTSHQLHNVMETSQSLTESISFLQTITNHLRSKFCFLGLLARRKFTDPAYVINKDLVEKGQRQYDKLIVQPGYQTLLLPDETEKQVGEDKVLISQISQLRTQNDYLILIQQIEENEMRRKKILSLSNNSTDEFKNELLQSTTDILKFLTAEPLALTDSLDAFFIDSIGICSDKWAWEFRKILEEQFNDKERKVLLNSFSKVVLSRFNHQMEAELASKQSQNLIKLSDLEKQLRSAKKTIEAKEGCFIIETKNDFKNLIDSLNTRKITQKAKFSTLKNVVIEGVEERIEDAKKVKFERCESEAAMESVESDNELKGTETDINGLRKRIRMLRVLRCLSSMAMQKFFTKRMQSFEADRKKESAKMWNSMREFEVEEEKMLEQVQDGYDELANCGVRIERLKKELDEEKKCTIELVRWKATNTKIETELKERLNGLKNVNREMGSLLQSVDDAHSVLQSLQNDTFPIEAERKTIKASMQKVEKVREQVREAKVSKANGIPDSGDASSSAEDLKEENLQLQARNESLRRQIREFERSIIGASGSAQKVMEDVLPTQMKQRPSTRQITRPTTTPRKRVTVDPVIRSVLK